MTPLAILAVRLYRNLLSPLMLPSCKYLPTCSQYAEQALNRYGVVRGTWLTVCRMFRCHPLSPGGVDLVP